MWRSEHSAPSSKGANAMPRIRLRGSDSGTADVRTSAASGRHRAGPDVLPASTSSHSGRKRWSAGVAATAVVLGTMAAIAPSASAALASFGPIDPENNFPAYFADTNGLALEICQDGLPNCLAGPELIKDIHAAGGDAEAFYYAADASTDTFALHNALEAAYGGDGPDQETFFMRTQVTARAGGLVAGGTYNVTDPYGPFTCV